MDPNPNYPGIEEMTRSLSGSDHARADVFASLVEQRPYKPAAGVEEAMVVLDQMAGTKVDISNVRILRRLVNEAWRFSRVGVFRCIPLPSASHQ